MLLRTWGGQSRWAKDGVGLRWGGGGRERRTFVLSIRQKAKLLFFTRSFGWQPGLADCSMLSLLKRFHPQSFFFQCFTCTSDALRDLWPLWTTVLRLDAPRHWLSGRSSFRRVTYSLDFRLIYSTLYWLQPLSDLTAMPHPSTLTHLPHGLSFLLTKLQSLLVPGSAPYPTPLQMSYLPLLFPFISYLSRNSQPVHLRCVMHEHLVSVANTHTHITSGPIEFSLN